MSAKTRMAPEMFRHRGAGASNKGAEVAKCIVFYIILPSFLLQEPKISSNSGARCFQQWGCKPLPWPHHFAKMAGFNMAINYLSF